MLEAPDTPHPPAALRPGEPPRPAMRPLKPAIKTIWSIKLGLWTAAILIGVLFYEVTHLFADDRLVPPFVWAGLVFIAGVALSLAVPRLRYRYWRFDLRPEELYLERGILNRVRTVVPLRRIQHLDVSQDVLEREFDLGKLIVHTAGSRSSDVVLPGLNIDEAEQLRDTLKHYILDDAV